MGTLSAQRPASHAPYLKMVPTSGCTAWLYSWLLSTASSNTSSNLPHGVQKEAAPNEHDLCNRRHPIHQSTGCRRHVLQSGQRQSTQLLGSEQHPPECVALDVLCEVHLGLGLVDIQARRLAVALQHIRLALLQLLWQSKVGEGGR